MPTATQSLTGAYVADPVHSSFGFAVTYQGISTFRGTLDDVVATLEPGADGGLELTGAAEVASISVRTPEQFRAHLLSEEFFDAERHPAVRFASNAVELADDGRATVEGELEIRGATRPVTARGRWSPPAEDAFGKRRAHLELTATIDRTEFGMNWNLPLPNGAKALANEVVLTVDLALVAQE